VAKQPPNSVSSLIADRVGAQVHHFAGDHARGRLLAERVLRHPARTIPLSYGQTPVDRQVSMRIILARIAWLEGYPDQAVQIAGEAVQLAASDGPLAMCHTLGLASCPIAFWCGDLLSATRLTQHLLEFSRRYNFDRWTKLASRYQRSVEMLATIGAVEIKGHPSVSVTASEITSFPEILPTICAAWLDPVTLDRAQRGLCGWAGAEISRVSCEMHLRSSSMNAEMIETVLDDALKLARGQKALAWELRITTSLARLWNRQGRGAKGAQVLSAVYARFDEGHATADLRTARTLIAELNS
jgi:hypothetical protein